MRNVTRSRWFAPCVVAAITLVACFCLFGESSSPSPSQQSATIMPVDAQAQHGTPLAASATVTPSPVSLDVAVQPTPIVVRVSGGIVAQHQQPAPQQPRHERTVDCRCNCCNVARNDGTGVRWAGHERCTCDCCTYRRTLLTSTDISSR